eukprot:766428-Hanusia_phi.AAC.13
MAMPAVCLSFMVADIEARRLLTRPFPKSTHSCLLADRHCLSPGRRISFFADMKQQQLHTTVSMAGINDEEEDELLGLANPSAFDFIWDGHDAMVFENFRCTSRQIASHIRNIVQREPAKVSQLIAHFGEEVPGSLSIPAMGARLLRLTYLSSPLRHLMEDEILGTKTVVSLFVLCLTLPNSHAQDFRAEDILGVVDASETEGSRLLVNRKKRDNSVSRVLRRKVPEGEDEISGDDKAARRLQEFTVQELKVRER